MGRRSTILMAILFMIGSFCFALGSVPLYFENVSYGVTGTTFFVGSLFFTSASFIQLLQARAVHDYNLAAAIVQFVGTLFFNATTFHALTTGLDAQEADRLVWAPDALGSICFLVSSWFAIVALHRAAIRRPDLGWWIAWLNMLGSIAFGLSAIVSFVLPTTGEVINVRVVNAQTFIGGVCFFVASYLMLPQLKRSEQVNA